MPGDTCARCVLRLQSGAQQNPGTLRSKRCSRETWLLQSAYVDELCTWLWRVEVALRCLLIHMLQNLRLHIALVLDLPVHARDCTCITI